MGIKTLYVGANENALSAGLRGAVGFSRALHSNWLWMRAFNLLVDAGEGVQMGLGDRVGSPARVLITHGHSDHVLGLPSLVAARQFASPISGGELEIVYPRGCPGVLASRRFITEMWPDEDFSRILWRETGVGDQIPAGTDRYIEPFSVEHGDGPSLGYALVERRRRLREPFRDLAKEDLRGVIGEQGRLAVTEEYEHTLFAHTGDARVIEFARLPGADLVVYDCTFLLSSDRHSDTHASAEEVWSAVGDKGVGDLVLHHLSLRYDRAEAIEWLKGHFSGFTSNVYLWDRGNLHSIWRR